MTVPDLVDIYGCREDFLTVQQVVDRQRHRRYFFFQFSENHQPSVCIRVRAGGQGNHFDSVLRRFLVVDQDLRPPDGEAHEWVTVSEEDNSALGAYTEGHHSIDWVKRCSKCGIELKCSS